MYTRARSVLLGMAMVLAVFLANGFITFFNLRRIHHNTAVTRQSHEVLIQLKNVRIRMLDAETGMRGFVLTGDGAFLQPYEEAIASITQTRRRLDELIVDSSLEQQMLETAFKQIDASLAYMSAAIERRRTAGLEAAAQHIGESGGRALMGQIRESLRNMEAEEHALLDNRERESRAAYVTAMATGLLTCLLGMGLTGFAYVFITREMNKRDQAVLGLRQANDFLENRVAERTAELSKANSVMRMEIDERRRAEEQVRLFAEELQRSNRELEQFASVASHDLQEPLRKIQAFGDRLSERFREELTSQGKDYIDRMLASAKRMRTLIDDLLEFSRVTTKAQPFASVNLTDILQDVAGDLEARLQQTGGRVELGELPVVRASPLQMRQLFQNLLSNALKFHRPDTPPVVRVSAHTLPAEGDDAGAGLQCQIVVEDNGIGFEPEYGERIFDLFQRLHGRDEYDGTGIGLAICRKIVDRHNGQISAESSPGEGSRFLVTLPVDSSA